MLCAGLSHYLADKVIEHRAQNMMAITAPNGQSMSVTLSDGTTVWLNSGRQTGISFDFSRKTRRVKISGEAMFEVEHDAGRSFVVETFACDAEVLGTKLTSRQPTAPTSSFGGAARRTAENLEPPDGRRILHSFPNEQIDSDRRTSQINRITDPDDFAGSTD